MRTLWNEKGKRWAALAVVTTAVLVAVFYIVGGWYFSGLLYKYGLSAAARRAQKPNYAVRVLAVGNGVITLEREILIPTVVQPGVWGVQWQSGYGEVGSIVSDTPFSVTRKYHGFVGNLTAGTRISMESFVFPINPTIGLGLKYQGIYFSGPLGRYPAWFIPGRSNTWAITIHGNSMLRTDTMKIVPQLHAQGLPVLVITYRNDRGAPFSPNGMLGYGSTEWSDLQAATYYALAHGAKHIVLVGYSMGGSIALSFLQHSVIAPKVSATILDAPMMNFATTVDYGASEQRFPIVDTSLPPALITMAKFFATVRFGVNWSAMNYFPGMAKVHCPILLFQGTKDQTIPPYTSTELAKELPHLVTYVQTVGAGHIASWNLNPPRYDASVGAFLNENHI